MHTHIYMHTCTHAHTQAYKTMGKKVMNLKESIEQYMAWSEIMKGKGEIMQLHNIKSFFKK